mgnify:FL=1
MELGSNILHQLINCLEFPLHIWALDNLLGNIFVDGQIARARVSDMNDFYYVSETDPFHLVDDVGLIDDVWS